MSGRTVAELIWTGKHDAPEAGPREDVPSCRTDEIHGSESGPSPPNRLICGDRKGVLRALSAELAGQVALVYVDPPFDTGATFDYLATIPGAPPGAPRVTTPAYHDARGLDAWLGWFAETVRLLHGLLAAGGSLYVHLDAHTVHYAKVVLDEVFGGAGFQREIIWRIGWVSGFKSRARSWIRNHDTLLFYAKGEKPRTFNKEYLPYPPGYVRRDGSSPKAPGYPIEDVWNGSEGDRLDSIQIVSFSGEKVGFPTQKNEALVSRIVRASSNPGEIVLDCFVGSGTTAVAAERLGRRWIASDASAVAIHASRKRIAGLTPRARPFLVQTLDGGRPRALDGLSPVEDASRAAAGEHVGELSIDASVDDLHLTISVTAFRPSPERSAAIPEGARRHIAHWSQWIDGWCVDWENDGCRLRAGSSVWRPPKAGSLLPLSLTRAYSSRGRYRVVVKVFDLLGGYALAALSIDIA